MRGDEDIRLPVGWQLNWLQAVHVESRDRSEVLAGAKKVTDLSKTNQSQLTSIQ